MSFVEKPPYFGCPNGKIGLLSSMFTEPQYRRKGIAKELLSRVVKKDRLHICHIKKYNKDEKHGRCFVTAVFQICPASEA